NEFLPPVAIGRIPLLLHLLAPLRIFGPALLRDRGPPVTERFIAHDGAGLTQFADPFGAGGDPEMTLGADDAGPGLAEEAMKYFRVTRPPRAIDEVLNSIFFRFGRVLGKAIELLGPDRMLLRALKIEAAGIENTVERHPG